MDWSIQELARLAGTTSRTLRHYDDIGLLAPSRIAGNGYRHYDEAGLVRLQRILLLRQLGLGLTDIANVLDREVAEADALSAHLELLRHEADHIQRQIAAVESTLRARQEGTPLMATEALDGFDHTQYKTEVEQRWGKDSYITGDTWWRGMSDTERSDFKAISTTLSADWTDAATRDIDPEGDEAQALAARHIAWLSGIPGTPAAQGDTKEYVLGLAEMYVADERFAANYGGLAGAQFVRAALQFAVR